MKNTTKKTKKTPKTRNGNYRTTSLHRHINYDENGNIDFSTTPPYFWDLFSDDENTLLNPQPPHDPAYDAPISPSNFNLPPFSSEKDFWLRRDFALDR